MNRSRWALALVGSVLLFMPQPLAAQATCAPQLDALRQDLRTFDDAARQLPPGFPRAEAEEAALGGATGPWGRHPSAAGALERSDQTRRRRPEPMSLSHDPADRIGRKEVD